VLLGLRTRQQDRRRPGHRSSPPGRSPRPRSSRPTACRATGSTYDSSAYDVYSVPPVASTLFRPTGTGQYAQYGNGTVAEIESDGSQLGLTYGQWNDLIGTGAKVTQVLPVGAPAGRTPPTTRPGRQPGRQRQEACG
jgi:hypothetical protein